MGQTRKDHLQKTFRLYQKRKKNFIFVCREKRKKRKEGGKVGGRPYLYLTLMPIQYNPLFFLLLPGEWLQRVFWGEAQAPNKEMGTRDTSARDSKSNKDRNNFPLPSSASRKAFQNWRTYYHHFSRETASETRPCERGGNVRIYLSLLTELTVLARLNQDQVILASRAFMIAMSGWGQVRIYMSLLTELTILAELNQDQVILDSQVIVPATLGWGQVTPA